MPRIEELGAELIAICPQREVFLKKLIERHGLTFDVLRDEGNEVAASFGLKWSFPNYLRELYTSFGIEIDRLNGTKDWTLPMPARYLVASDGTIAAADFDPDYRFRPEPQKTIDDLEKLVADG